MKKRKKELEVDFIGIPNSPLTKEEANAISDFIRTEKEKLKLKGVRKKTIIKRREKQLAR